MVKVWALYTHMSKAMPPLVQHWNSLEEHQEAREKIKGITEKVKQMNMELRQKK
ncbi:YusU family protein [Microaerobacter geothermalis]|nr:YusU family protein [Microaerobacter geothermalis]